MPSRRGCDKLQEDWNERGRGKGGGGKYEASPLTENERIGEDDDLQ